MLSGTIAAHPRTLDLDYDVTAFLQDWLDSEQSANARRSLAGRAGLNVLVLMASLDGPAANLIHTVQEAPGEVPAAALRLPEEVDVLVVATSTDVLRFARNEGWTRHDAPPLM